MVNKRIVVLAIPIIMTCAYMCKPDNKLRIELLVSSKSSQLFKAIKKDVYSKKEIAAVLNRLAKSSSRFCKSIFGKGKGAKKAEKLMAKVKLAKGYLKDSLSKKEKKKLLKNIKKDLSVSTMLGCSNWYKLTDTGLNKTFPVVKENVKSKHLHCYSVGLMQPYIMASKLNCSKVTFVDIDHRILQFHHKAVSKMLQKKNGTVNWSAFVEEYNFSFPTGFKKKEKKSEASLSLKDICGAQKNLCQKSLKSFHKKIQKKKFVNITFFLSALSDMDIAGNPIQKGEKENSFFYLSNAIDPQFTKPMDFQRFFNNYGSSLLKAGFFLYHQSGADEFGMYKVKPNKKITEICSDKFVTTAKPFFDLSICEMVTPKALEYFTALDDKAGVKAKKNLCSE